MAKVAPLALASLALLGLSLTACPQVDTSSEGMNHHDKRTGKKTGLWTTYHKNGQKESEGRYEEGRKVGAWSYWDATGALIRTEVWKAGILSDTFDGADAARAAPPPAMAGQEGLGDRMGRDADQGVGGVDHAP